MYGQFLNSKRPDNEATKRVEFLSRHDELTGLPNRYHIKEFLTGQLAKEDIHNSPFAMICLDLDKFKPVNDIFGHSTGDALLGEVASRLKQCERAVEFLHDAMTHLFYVVQVPGVVEKQHKFVPALSCDKITATNTLFKP